LSCCRKPARRLNVGFDFGVKAVKLLVLGGGLAGLATALATSRAGHDVVLVERDADSPVVERHSG
jgi:NADPH-dependent 2,4-dienoyl-CoA reductase/sulfur reductase-like enzyme